MFQITGQTLQSQWPFTHTCSDKPQTEHSLGPLVVISQSANGTVPPRRAALHLSQHPGWAVIQDQSFPVCQLYGSVTEVSRATESNSKQQRTVIAISCIHSQTQWHDVIFSPVLCSKRALLFILGAEVRGALQVNQLVLPHRPDVNIFGYQLLARPHGPVNHFGGRQVLGLQVHGNLPQVLQASPASSYGAGARYTMTFTFHHQRVSQRLDMWREDIKVR